MFKEDFQEALKFQWIEKGIWIVTTESEDRANWGRIYHGGEDRQPHSHQEGKTGSPVPRLNKKLCIDLLPPFIASVVWLLVLVYSVCTISWAG